MWRAWGVALAQRYKESWFDRHFRFSMPISIALFVLALFVNFAAIQYATERASNPVDDIILSNTPVFEIDGLFVYGTLVYVLFALALVLVRPNRIPFALHALTLFFLIRAVFTSLTHIGLFEASYTSDFGATITRAFFGADSFFSGHTGMPFLGALAFWHQKNLRYIFLAGTLYFAAIVLLGHLHYSIDVLAAPFITYGIYHIALWLFPKERALFLSEK